MILVLNSTGEGIKGILSAESALVTKNMDNTLYCDLDCAYTPENAELIKEGTKIEVTGKHGGLFRIKNPIISGTRLKSRCYSCFKDAENYIIKHLVLSDSTVTEALDALEGACDTKNSLILSTDFPDDVKVTYEFTNTTLAEALEILKNITGGYLYTKSNTIYLYVSLEKEIIHELRYGDNIKTFKKTEDWSQVCTKIMPIGKDGIMLDEIYLESDKQYETPYTKIVEFEQNIEVPEEGISSPLYEFAVKTELKALANAYLEEHSEPDVTYEVEAHITFDVDIGNTLPLIYPKLKVNKKMQVMEIQWDGVSQRYKSIKFGKPLPIITGLYSKLTKK